LIRTMSVLRQSSIYANETQQLWRSIDDPTSIGPTGPQGSIGPTGPQGIEGFSSGAVYYFNRSTASDIPGYFVLSKTPVIGAGSSLSASGAGTVLIGQFATPVGDPGTTVIPAGNYTFDIFVNMSASGGTPGIFASIFTRTSGGVETLIATNSTAPQVITQGTSTELYVFSLGVPQTLISGTDRVVMKLFAVNLGGLTMNVKFEDNEIAQVITSLSPALVGPTGPTGSAANVALWANFPATGPVNFNNKDANSIANVNASDVRTSTLKVGGLLPLLPAATIGTLGNASVQALNVGSSTTNIGDVNIYGSTLLAGDNALYVEGGVSLSGNGIVHGVHLGAQTIGGIDLTRIDVLPVGININSDTYVQTAAAGAISIAAGGAVSIAGGGYIEMNTGSVDVINSSSGNQASTITCANYLAPANVAATQPLKVQNTAGGGVWLQGVTQLQGQSCAMTNISTINGNPVTTFLAQQVREVQPTGVFPADQSSIASYVGSFFRRTLNNYVPVLSGTNSTVIPGMSISGNQITLSAGTYYVNGGCPAGGVSGFTIRLYDITNATTAIAGTSEWSAAGVITRSLINGVLTVTAPTVYEIQQRIVSTGGGSGFLGRPSTFTPEVEVYTNFTIVKTG
jgi:hypothetical protein